MKEFNFDNLIEDLRCIDIPECPGDIEKHVQRTIRLQLATGDIPFVTWLNRCLSQFKLLVPALGVAASVSIFVTIFSLNAAGGEDRSSASKALGFDVITESSMFNWDK